MPDGVKSFAIHDTPIAVIDFETTGLNPGEDRVVEMSVVRLDPGAEPRLVFDTLINPDRPVSASEVHGIHDQDVCDAPRFNEVADQVLTALSDCVIAAYNVYFDIRFLDFELQQAERGHRFPHFCVMYLRPLLDLGRTCRLAEACQSAGIELSDAHVAAADTLATAQLLQVYLAELREKGITTFGELPRIRRYRFFESFEWSPFKEVQGTGSVRLKSRYRH